MKYLNGNDMPEHVRQVLKDVIMNGEAASVTLTYGNAMLISKDEYERLTEAAQGNAYRQSDYGHFRSGDMLERFFREEIDF